MVGRDGTKRILKRSVVQQRLVTIALLLLASAAEGQIRVTLGPETTVTFPGVRPELIITLENVGSEVAEVDARFTLRVWPEGAEEPFIASSGRDEADATFDWFHPESLEPGATAELYLVQNRAQIPWFDDDGVNQPGEYRLQISTPHGESNWITMVVTKPEGRDAEAWDAIKAGLAYRTCIPGPGLLPAPGLVPAPRPPELYL